MRVSVALCTFNGSGPHLEAQLASLANQSRRPDELVVGDDCSSDETLGVLRRFAESVDFEVKIHVNPERLGIHGNFEQTFGRCTGDVIFPCDQDDAWEPDKIQHQLTAFANADVTMCICQSMVCDASLKTSGQTVFDQQRVTRAMRSDIAAGDGLKTFIRHNVAPGHAMAFRSSLVGTICPIPVTCVYDQWVALIASSMGRTAFVDRPLLRYRIHSAQSVGANHKSLAEWSKVQSTLKLDHLQRNVETHRLAIDRLPGVQGRVRQLLEGKVRFLEARIAMRRGRFTRTLIATRLLLAGQYVRFGRGLLTFGRDLKGDGRTLK